MNFEEMKQQSLNALMVVVHPDDEVIWAGGLVQQTPNWQWTIMSLCRMGDADREAQFRQACEQFHAECIMSDLDDGYPLQPIDVDIEIGGRIRNAVGHGRWDVCITHGDNGEFGHLRHLQVSRCVSRLVSTGSLDCGVLLNFAYDCDAESGRCDLLEDADVRLALTPEEFAEKRRIISCLYGLEENCFENKVCAQTEGFKSITVA